MQKAGSVLLNERYTENYCFAKNQEIPVGSICSASKLLL